MIYTGDSTLWFVSSKQHSGWVNDAGASRASGGNLAEVLCNVPLNIIFWSWNSSLIFEPLRETTQILMSYQEGRLYSLQIFPFKWIESGTWFKSFIYQDRIFFRIQRSLQSKGYWFESQFLLPLLWIFSGFLPQSRDVQIGVRLIGACELTVGVKAVYLSVSAWWCADDLSRMPPRLWPKAAGIGSSPPLTPGG